jgi:hypothetical protein
MRTSHKLIAALIATTTIGLGLTANPTQGQTTTTAAPVNQVRPVVECREVRTDGTTWVWFGYQNDWNAPITIPLGGSTNKITPAPQDRGQPTTFAIGRQRKIFAVELKNPANHVWTLKSPNGSTRTATASTNTTLCAAATTTTAATTTLPITTTSTTTTTATTIPPVADELAASDPGEVLSASAQKLCVGPKAIVGTASGDSITGTSQADIICGLGGDDIINGLGGDDLIVGGAGLDALNGNDGNDVILGGDDLDTLRGGQGADVIVGDRGNDSLEGEAGGDELYGSIGDDRIDGGGDADKLFGGDGSDAHVGGDGDDLFFGSNGTDSVAGDDGWDECYDIESGTCDSGSPLLSSNAFTVVAPWNNGVRLETRNGDLNPQSVAIIPVQTDIAQGVEFEITSTGSSTFFGATSLTVPVSVADEQGAQVEFYDPLQDLWFPYPDQTRNGNGSITVRAEHFTRVKVAKGYRDKTIEQVLGRTIVDGPPSGRTCISLPFFSKTVVVALYDTSGSSSQLPIATWIPDGVDFSLVEMTDSPHVLQTNTGNTPQIGLAAFGEARLAPSLSFAIERFRNSSRNFRQLVITTDGGFRDEAPVLISLADELNRYGVSVTVQGDIATFSPAFAAFWAKLSSKRQGLAEQTFDSGSDRDEDNLSDCEEASGVVAVRDKKTVVVQTKADSDDTDGDGLPDIVEIATEDRLSNTSGAQAFEAALPYGRRGRHLQADPTKRNSGGSMVSDKFDYRSETDVFKAVPGEVGFLPASAKMRRTSWTVCPDDPNSLVPCKSYERTWDQVAKDFGAPTKELNPGTLNESDWMSLAIGLYFNFRDSETTYNSDGSVRSGVNASEVLWSAEGGKITFPKYGQGTFWASLNKEGKNLIWTHFGSKIVLSIDLYWARYAAKLQLSAMIIGFAVIGTVFAAWGVALVAGALTEGAVLGASVLTGITVVGGVSVASIAVVASAVVTSTVFVGGVICRGHAQLNDSERGICTQTNVDAFDVMFSQMEPGIDLPALKTPYSGPLSSSSAFSPSRKDDLGRTNLARINDFGLPPLDDNGLPLRLSRVDTSVFTTKMIGRSRYRLVIDAQKRGRSAKSVVFWARPGVPKSSAVKGFGNVEWKFGVQTQVNTAKAIAERAKYPNAKFFDDFENLRLDDVALARFRSTTLTGDQKTTGPDYKQALDSIGFKTMEEAEAHFGVGELTWHHTIDGCGMLLVPFEIHKAFSHWGGSTAIEKSLKAC